MCFQFPKKFGCLFHIAARIISSEIETQHDQRRDEANIANDEQLMKRHGDDEEQREMVVAARRVSLYPITSYERIHLWNWALSEWKKKTG